MNQTFVSRKLKNFFFLVLFLAFSRSLRHCVAVEAARLALRLFFGCSGLRGIFAYSVYVNFWLILFDFLCYSHCASILMPTSLSSTKNSFSVVWTEPTHQKQRTSLHSAQTIAIYRGAFVHCTMHISEKYLPRCASEARSRMHGTAKIPYVSLKYWTGSHRKTKRKTLLCAAAAIVIVVVVIIIRYSREIAVQRLPSSVLGSTTTSLLFLEPKSDRHRWWWFGCHFCGDGVDNDFSSSQHQFEREQLAEPSS